MQPNLTKKEIEDAYRSCGLYEDVFVGIVPKTEAELTAFIEKHGCADVSVNGIDDESETAFLSIQDHNRIQASFDNRPQQVFKSLPDAYAGIVLHGLPISKQIGEVRVRGFAII